MAPRTEHWQNHPPDSQAEAVAVAVGVVPATDLREAPPICSAGPQPYGFFRRGEVADGKAAERTVLAEFHLDPSFIIPRNPC